jgi:molecular chaperone HtpG
MTTPTPTTMETYAFQAETAGLLRLVIHSLYPSKDLFLRELLSNASDALDKLRFEAIGDPTLLADDPEPRIRLEVDAAARTLSISDNGIGMHRQELIDHIGTIARSGTREFASRIQAVGSAAQLAELIGQFGVGFYSAFMVADRIHILTRRAGGTEAVEWISTGDGTYTVQAADKPTRGTTVVLHLQPADAEAGLADYTEYWTLASLVAKYSDFISYPIRATSPSGADETLNAMKPLWKRPAAEITADEYREFYTRLTHDERPPIETIHFHAEGTLEYDALLYVPAHGSPDLYYVAPEWGVQLLVRRVTIAERSPDVLPRYLRFVRGVVDCADLSLDVSRLRLQNAQQLAQIRRRLTRKVLETLARRLEQDRDAYIQLWTEYGRAIKEGVASDAENKARLLSIALWQTSHPDHPWTTLPEYVARMAPDQPQILYITGESRAVLDQAPHLEALRARGVEVLYMTNPVDELLLQYVPDFEGKPLKSVAKGTLPTEPETTDGGEEAAFAGVASFLQTHLADHVKRVRLSSRLTVSPVCLVVEDHDYSPMLDRALRTDHAPVQRRVLELNPKHPVIQGLRTWQAARPDDEGLREAADLLFGVALLAEGSPLIDPVRFNRAALDVLGKAVALQGPVA